MNKKEQIIELQNHIKTLIIEKKKSNKLDFIQSINADIDYYQNIIFYLEDSV